MESKENNVVYDDITNYGITIVNNDMYLIKGGKMMKLDALYADDCLIEIDNTEGGN